jgi:hypothetical protein
MKKINLIDAIIDFLASDNAGDSKGVYHPEIIKVHLNDVYNQAVYNTWMVGKQLGEFSQLDAWCKTYSVTVVQASRGNGYALLPFAPVQLPNGDGIRQVYDYYSYGDVVLAPIEATARGIFADLEVGSSLLGGVATWCLEMDIHNTGEGEPSHMLRLANLPAAPGNYTTLSVLMVTPMDRIGDYDDVVCPAGTEDSLIKGVIDLMMRKPAPDTNNDMIFEKKG